MSRTLVIASIFALAVPVIGCGGSPPPPAPPPPPPATAEVVVETEPPPPPPVQVEVVPRALEGRDVLAGAQTGTGKTAAFVLPILQRLSETPASSQCIRALILTPTRKLAAQIADRVAAYGRHLRIRHTVVYGGVSQHRQEIALRNAPDLVVATPGRLLDLMQQRLVRLDGVTHFVLDEADRMLDMGFVHDVRRVVAALPAARQTLFFSATIAGPIETLARTMLANPARVSITPTVTTAEGVEQSVVFVDKADKRAMLERLLREPGETGDVGRTLVFTRTKHGANRLSDVFAGESEGPFGASPPGQDRDDGQEGGRVDEEYGAR